MKCPIAKTAEIMGDHWTILIVRDLLQTERRFCELEKSLDGISTRTLTIKLKQLQEDKLITHREQYYKISPKGKALGQIIKDMEVFGRKYL